MHLPYVRKGGEIEGEPSAEFIVFKIETCRL